MAKDKTSAALGQRLDRVIHEEAFLWGSAVSAEYHGIAASHMDAQWDMIIAPVMARHPLDLARSIDFAAGFGRNTRKLLEAGAAHVTMVDVNPDCIAHLEANFAGPKATALLNGGTDLSALPSGAFTFLYTFDAMVHFDLEIVAAYLPEFARVLKPGGFALIHHSNYTDNPGADFRQNPHWRNFMSAAIFKHLAMRSGFTVEEQMPFDWGGLPLDCITVLRRAAE